MNNTSAIKEFHSHVYFDAQTIARATSLCEAARDRFSIKMGRVHQKPVGPHPHWSCQLAYEPERAGEVISWLALNRDELVVFTHPNTGDDLADHTKHAIWMGAIKALRLEIFK